MSFIITANLFSPDNCTGPIVAAVVVPVIIFIMLILVIALIMYKCKLYRVAFLANILIVQVMD